MANGTRASMTYDAASQVTQVYNLKSDDSVIAGFAYEYDAAGNRTAMLESGGDRVTWSYDATNRLTREQRSGAEGYDTTYTYDALGNRLVKEASGVRTTSTYDLANQQQTSEDATGVTTFTYDQAGNLHIVESPTGQRTTNTWDDQNHQTGVAQPDGSLTTCTYRFDGLRSSKEDSDGTTKYLWDLENYLAETDADNELQAVYTNEPQPYGNLISQYRKDGAIWTPSYYQYDALGSTGALTDDGGDVTDTYLYDAWGNEMAVTGTTVNPFRWVGQVGYYWDEGTGTFYIRARVYEPVTGRWHSSDELGFIEGVNLYLYVVNRSLNWVDPTGLMTVTISDASVHPCGGYSFDYGYRPTYKKGVRDIVVFQRICVLAGYLRNCVSEGACCRKEERKECRPCCYLERLRVGPGILEAGAARDEKYPSVPDHAAYTPITQPGCTSQGILAEDTTVKAFDVRHRDFPFGRLQGWKEGIEFCDAGCRVFPVDLRAHIVLEDGNPPAWFDNENTIVDQISHEVTVKWSCCNRRNTNWQTIDLPVVGKRLYWHGGAPDVIVEDI